VTVRPHDALFKAAFETPAHAAGLFRGVLPPSVVAAIAWETISLVPGSFIDPDLADRQSDLLYAVELRGARALLYLLLEHQSSSDPDMPLRMLVYMVRIWERCRRDHPGDALPPVIPLVVSHAPGGWTAPRTFGELLDPDPSTVDGLADLVPAFSLLVEDLAGRSNAEIKALAIAAFPRLALWALRDGRDRARLLANFADLGHAILEVARAPHGVQALAQLLRYIALVTDDLQLEQFRAKLAELAPEAEQAAMTIAEQMRREGREEGRAEVLRKLLSLKFGTVRPEHEARLSAATPAELDRWVERVLTAKTIEDVLAD
jgi:predicted transposase YdaD